MAGFSYFLRQISARFRHVKIRGTLKNEFNASFYSTIYSPILPTKWDELDHYIRVGQFKGFDPSPDFSVSHYLELQGDVLRGGAEPYSHFIHHGRSEGRVIQPSALKRTFERIQLSNAFDEDLYRSTVSRDELVGTNPLDHYLTIGWHQGYAPNSWLNPEHYKHMYPDVAVSPLEDYVISNGRRGRYLSVRHAIMSGLEDKLNITFREGVSFGEILTKILRHQPNFFERWAQLCHGIGLSDKIYGFVHNWIFFFSRHEKAPLAKILFEKLTICDDIGPENHIALYMSHPHSCEGELSLSFFHGEDEIFLISFNVSPGRVFGFADENVILVTRVQGFSGRLEANRQISKQLNDVTPCYAIFSALQGVARAWDISRIVAVNSEHQLSNTPDRSIHFRQIYDAFFESHGGVLLANGFYDIALPIRQKPLAMIKRDHRARTRVKRALKASIEENACETMLGYLRPRAFFPEGKRRVGDASPLAVNDDAARMKAAE